MAEQATVEKYVGQSVERVEDARLLTGRARFADHYPTPTGTLHAAVLRSPHAHADIVAIDLAKAKALPGVRAVYTGEDIKAISDPFLVIVKQPLNEWALAVDRVRFVGEAVAVVLASDRYLAEDALDQIVVEYKILKPVIDATEAASHGAGDSGVEVIDERVAAGVGHAGCRRIWRWRGRASARR